MHRSHFVKSVQATAIKQYAIHSNVTKTNLNILSPWNQHGTYLQTNALVKRVHQKLSLSSIICVVRLMKEDVCKKKKTDKGEWVSVNYPRAKRKFPNLMKNQTFFGS